MSVNTSVLQGMDGGKLTTFRPAECIKKERPRIWGTNYLCKKNCCEFLSQGKPASQ